MTILRRRLGRSEVWRLGRDKKTYDQAKQTEDGAENLNDQDLDEPVILH